MLHLLSLLPLYLAFFILYIYSFYDFRKQQKKESVFGPTFSLLLSGTVIWVWFGIPGNWRWRLREGGDFLLRNGMDVFYRQ